MEQDVGGGVQVALASLTVRKNVTAYQPHNYLRMSANETTIRRKSYVTLKNTSTHSRAGHRGLDGLLGELKSS
jgi:hypothetical protein